jgi:hypothetical protein
MLIFNCNIFKNPKEGIKIFQLSSMDKKILCIKGRHAHHSTQVDNQTHIHIFFISCSCLMIFMTMNVPSESLKYLFGLQCSSQ